MHLFLCCSSSSLQEKQQKIAALPHLPASPIVVFVTGTPTVDLDEAQMMGIQATSYELGTRSDEGRNSGNWERRREELETLGPTQEYEDRDERQGDKMRRNKT